MSMVNQKQRTPIRLLAKLTRQQKVGLELNRKTPLFLQNWVEHSVEYHIHPVINCLISNITLQILLYHCHTLHIEQRRGEFLNLPSEFMLSNHILYSHDFAN